jgi:hypothetical protein
VHRAVGSWRAAQAARGFVEREGAALVAVPIRAVAHYWLLTDIFTSHFSGVKEDHYSIALVDLAASTLTKATAAARNALEPTRPRSWGLEIRR